MKAVVLQGAGARRVELDPPRIGPGELLLEMRACGLCGTDLVKIEHPSVAQNTRLGHELVGVARDVGRGVRRFRAGDRLAVGHHVPCGRCRSCRHGNHSMCSQFKVTGIDPGGFAELVRVSAVNVRHAAFKLPPSMSDDAGTFVEPLACAIRAVRRSEVRKGDRIAVFGVGTMGLLIAQALRLLGARVFAVDIDSRRLDLARRLGIRNASDNAVKLTGLDGAILTAVLPATLEAAFRAVGGGGNINLFAGPSGEAKWPVDLDDLYHREISLFSTYSSTPEDLATAFRWLRDLKVRVKPLVSRRLPLDRFEEGVELQRSGRALKVVFHP